MAQGIYELLQETLKLTTKLNKQLCCQPEPPPPVGTRKFWLVSGIFAGRNMFIPNQAAFYTGNTVANILGSGNTDLAFMAVRSSFTTAGYGMNLSRTLSADLSSPFSTITPTYTFNDSVSGFPIIKSLKDLYAYVLKIVNNSFLATRNPQIIIKRVSSPIGTDSGTLTCDGFFWIGVDFDYTGQERDGDTIVYREYNNISIPGTINSATLLYSSVTNGFSASSSNVPMNVYPPAASWVNDVTAFGPTVIRENFSIPPGW